MRYERRSSIFHSAIAGFSSQYTDRSATSSSIFLCLDLHSEGLRRSLSLSRPNELQPSSSWSLFIELCSAYIVFPGPRLDSVCARLGGPKPGRFFLSFLRETCDHGLRLEQLFRREVTAGEVDGSILVPKAESTEPDEGRRKVFSTTPRALPAVISFSRPSSMHWIVLASLLKNEILISKKYLALDRLPIFAYTFSN